MIGYCYGLNSIKRFKIFVVLEPLIPDPFNHDSFEEDIPNDLSENIIYLEPLISDANISLIIFSKMFKNLLGLNIRFNKYIYKTSDPEGIIKYISKLINNIDVLLKEFEDIYNIEFWNYCISFYSSINKKIKVKLSEEKQNKINKNNFISQKDATNKKF